MDTWPTNVDSLRTAYDDFVGRYGKAHAVKGMAQSYGLSPQTVRRRLAAAGVRDPKERAQRPPLDELAAVHEAFVVEGDPRSVVGKLATRYGATHTAVRKWLEDAGLRTAVPRIPPKPITEPCPCGAKATTRYKGQDPALCFKCYMRTYASDKESKFRRTAREYIAEVKRNAICADCGGNFPPCVYHFDHVPERGPKLFNLGSGDYSIKAVQAEIAKCDIVCANCHAIRTWMTRDQPWIRRGPRMFEAAPDA